MSQSRVLDAGQEGRRGVVMAVEALAPASVPNSKLLLGGEMPGMRLNRGRDSQPVLASGWP